MPELQTPAADTQGWMPLTQQRVFRQLMNAFAYPGRIEPLCPGADAQGALTRILATLLDGEVSLADLDAQVSPLGWARLEVRRDVPERSNFVLARGDRAPDFQPRLGTLESPEGGATVLVRVGALGRGGELRLSGPGIRGERRMAVTGLDPAWIEARSQWNGAFPMGVDLILVDDRQLAALPRTTRIHTEGAR